MTAVAVLACGPAAAEWTDMGVTNGDFSTPGSLGVLGQTVGIPANNGTADNGKLYDDWKFLGGQTGSNATSTGGLGGLAVNNSNTNKNTFGYIVHDALTKADNTVWQITNTIYRFDFDLETRNYAYSVGALIYFGQTDVNNSATWKANNTRWSGGTNVVTEWGLPVQTNGGLKHYTLFWDNSGTSDWNPAAGDTVGKDYTTVIRTSQIDLGQSIRFGVYSSTGTYQWPELYLDNLSVSYIALDPQLTAAPASESLIDFGNVAVLDAGVSQYITLSNTGQAGSTINVSQIGMYGEDRGLFYAAGAVPVTLTAGGTNSAQYEIGFGGSFTPGLKTAQLKFTTSEGDVIYDLRANVIPEPATMALLLAGALGALLRKKRA
ncbi:MAG: PEP-CTERM sorting domain-containing protein [Phycisphaerae bacterium]